MTLQEKADLIGGYIFNGEIHAHIERLSNGKHFIGRMHEDAFSEYFPDEEITVVNSHSFCEKCRHVHDEMRPCIHAQ